jgi:crotonobetainyl-CoA:carnitine CoA-transferase CaiB-like acyl-CoA transferase
MTVRTTANEDVIIAAAERQLWRNTCDIAWQLGLHQRRVLELLLDDELDPYHQSRSTHGFHMIALYNFYRRTPIVKLII